MKSKFECNTYKIGFRRNSRSKYRSIIGYCLVGRIHWNRAKKLRHGNHTTILYYNDTNYQHSNYNERIIIPKTSERNTHTKQNRKLSVYTKMIYSYYISFSFTLSFLFSILMALLNCVFSAIKKVFFIKDETCVMRVISIEYYTFNIVNDVPWVPLKKVEAWTVLSVP